MHAACAEVDYLAIRGALSCLDELRSSLSDRHCTQSPGKCSTPANACGSYSTPFHLAPRNLSGG